MTESAPSHQPQSPPSPIPQPSPTPHRQAVGRAFSASWSQFQGKADARPALTTAFRRASIAYGTMRAAALPPIVPAPSVDVQPRRTARVMAVCAALLSSWVLYRIFRLIALDVNTPLGYIFFAGLSFVLLQMALAATPQRINYSGDGARTHSVAALVPVYNEDPAALRNALASLIDQTRPLDALSVVDDGTEGIDYGPVRDWFLTEARRQGIRAAWTRQANAGKRHAQVAAAGAVPPVDVFLMVDSDTILDRGAVEAILAPFANPEIHAVGGIFFVLNYDTNILTRIQEIWMTSVQLIVRAALSRVGSVVVISGAIAAFRSAVLLDNEGLYLGETLRGAPVTYSDDSLLTLLALERGKVVQQPKACALTLMPEKFSHHRRQQMRWMRGSMLRTLWRLSRLPVTRIAFWYAFWAILRQVLDVAIIITVIVWSVVLGTWLIALAYCWGLAFSAAIQTIISIPYLSIHRSDQPARSKALVIALAPVVALWLTLVIKPFQIWAMAT
ncbi:MAG: glycosyltransferase, partial [Bifidobacteriaceae bacterium]|nr:glycosyltransferase [Bifidobacteriaceae bacterium]